MTRRDPRELLPLKPFVFQILVSLLDGETHGWGLLRALEARDQRRILPGHLYRQLEAMVDEGLIDERPEPSRSPNRAVKEEGLRGAPPRRFFRLSAFGRRVALAEARRLDGLVTELRQKRVLPEAGRS